MSDRQLLDAVLTSQPSAGAPGGERTIAEEKDDQQLDRVTPLVPAWRNLVLVSALGVLGTLLFLAPHLCADSDGMSVWFLPCLLGEALGLCVLFPLLAHVAPSPHLHPERAPPARALPGSAK